MAYNVTSGSSATPDPGSDHFRRHSVIYSELQMLLLELKLKTSNNITKCLGVEMNNDQIVASKMIQQLSKYANYASIATWQKLCQFARQIMPKIMLA